MRGDRTLKVVLVVVGLLFTAGVIPLTMFFSREPAVPMIMSIYVTLGIFLLLAVRDPAANRSLIAFGGWANLAHAGVIRRNTGMSSSAENSREWLCSQSSVSCWSRWLRRNSLSKGHLRLVRRRTSSP